MEQDGEEEEEEEEEEEKVGELEQEPGRVWPPVPGLAAVLVSVAPAAVDRLFTGRARSSA